MPFYGSTGAQTTAIVDGSAGFAPAIREHRFPNAVWHQAAVADPNAIATTWAQQGQFIQRIPTHQIDDLTRYHPHAQYTTVPYQNTPSKYPVIKYNYKSVD